jgi:prepilin-type N-terminal cleavage/methylation domain-containing protein
VGKPARDNRRDESGISLIELLIAIAILGIAIVVIVAGMGTSIIGSDRHRKEVDATSVLLSAAEQVKSSATPHITCANTTSYLAPARSVNLPPGWTTNAITIPAIAYWDGASFQHTDGVSTNASATYTSATAAFTASDAGKVIAGTNIPVGATIASVTNSTMVLLSTAATATGSGLTFSVCRESGDDTVPLTLQLVTIQVQSPDSRATERVSVAKGA